MIRIAFAVIATAFSIQVYATGTNCMNSCATTVNVDSGHTSKRCDDNGSGTCTCAELATCYTWRVSSSNCSLTLETDYGLTAMGQHCCVKDHQNCPPADVKAADDALHVESNSTDDLASVYNPTAGLTTAYFGYVDNALRSPSSGRGNSAQAKLDACLFYSDVDALGTGLTGYNNCVGASVGCGATNKNEYCNANSAQVCTDRCECYFGYGTCDSL